VKAASEGGNRTTQRVERIKWLCAALRVSLRRPIWRFPSFEDNFRAGPRLAVRHLQGFAAAKTIASSSDFSFLDDACSKGFCLAFGRLGMVSAEAAWSSHVSAPTNVNGQQFQDCQAPRAKRTSRVQRSLRRGRPQGPFGEQPTQCCGMSLSGAISTCW